MMHLAYCDAKSKELDRLVQGQKSMLIRGAAGKKLPFGRVHPNEVIYFVENDGSRMIKAKGIVKAVHEKTGMNVDESVAMMQSFDELLQLSPAQIKRWSGKKCLCLIEIEQIEAIPPVPYFREKNMDDWIIFEELADILA